MEHSFRNFSCLFLLLVATFAFNGIVSGQQPCDESIKTGFIERNAYYRQLHHVPELLTDYEPLAEWAQQLADYWREYENTGYTPEHSWPGPDFNFVFRRVPPTEAQTGEAIVTEEYDRGERVYRENHLYGTEPSSWIIGEIENFTQMVWKNSSYIGVGCGRSDESGEIFVVAVYSPGGNLVDEFAENVLPPDNNEVNQDGKEKKKEKESSKKSLKKKVVGSRKSANEF